MFGGRCWHGRFHQVETLDIESVADTGRDPLPGRPAAKCGARFDEFMDGIARATFECHIRKAAYAYLQGDHPFAVWFEHQFPCRARSTSFCSSGSKLASDASARYFLAFSLFPEALRMMP